VSQDPQLDAAIEHILAGVRRQLEDGLRTYSADLRRQAHEHVQHARDLARQTDDARRAAEAQAVELKRSLDELRTRAQQQIDAAKQALDAELATVRTKAAREIDDARRLAEAKAADLQRDLEGRLQGLNAQLMQTRHELDGARHHAVELETRRAREAEERVRAERAHAVSEQQRLLDDVRSLDEARSLGEVLERLGAFAGRDGARTAVMLVKGERLQQWRSSGFGDAAGSYRSELEADKAGLIAAALREKQIVARAPADAAALPVFAVTDAPRAAAAFPVTVAGAVVAVLYADRSADEDASGPDWRHRLEILTSHGSRVLEALTMQRAAGLRSRVDEERPAMHGGRIWEGGV
jgi:hypothetical protein